MSGYAIGIDVGGTKIATGLVRFPEGKILACDIRPTLPERGAAAVLDEICDTAETMARSASVQAVGLALCELVDRAGNIVSNNCIAWNAADVRKRLSRIAPVTIEADVR